MAGRLTVRQPPENLETTMFDKRPLGRSLATKLGRMIKDVRSAAEIAYYGKDTGRGFRSYFADRDDYASGGREVLRHACDLKAASLAAQFRPHEDDALPAEARRINHAVSRSKYEVGATDPERAAYRREVATRAQQFARRLREMADGYDAVALMEELRAEDHEADHRLHTFTKPSEGRD